MNQSCNIQLLLDVKLCLTPLLFRAKEIWFDLQKALVPQDTLNITLCQDCL